MRKNLNIEIQKKIKFAFIILLLPILILAFLETYFDHLVPALSHFIKEILRDRKNQSELHITCICFTFFFFFFRGTALSTNIWKFTFNLYNILSHFYTSIFFDNITILNNFYVLTRILVCS